jgi:hypothetical protein
MGWGRVIETELMPSLVGGDTETVCSKLKSLKGFSKPKLETLPSVSTHAAVSNLFNLSRHKVRAHYYRDLRISAFIEWSRADALDLSLDSSDIK